MTDFNQQLEELLIAYTDSDTVLVEVAMNLQKSGNYDDLESRLIAYLDSDMITEDFGHNLLNTLGE